MDIAVTIVLFVIVVALTILVVLFGLKLYDAMSIQKTKSKVDALENTRAHDKLGDNINTVFEAQSTTRRALLNDMQALRSDTINNVSELSNNVNILNKKTWAVSNNVYSWGSNINSIQSGFSNIGNNFDQFRSDTTSNLTNLMSNLGAFEDTIDSKFATIDDSIKVMSTDVGMLKTFVLSNAPTITNNISFAMSNLQTFSNNLTQFNSNLSATRSGLALLEPRVDNVASQVSGISSLGTDVSTLKTTVDNMSNRFQTQQVNISDYTFKQDTEGGLRIDGIASSQSNYLLLENGRINKNLTIMPEGMLNFSMIPSAMDDDINNKYAFHIDKRNMMLKMPESGSLVLSGPNNNVLHTLDTTGQAVHSGGIVSQSVKIGNYMLMTSNNNLIVKNVESGAINTLLDNSAK
jgi:hypothetical protein